MIDNPSDLKFPSIGAVVFANAQEEHWIRSMTLLKHQHIIKVYKREKEARVEIYEKEEDG